MPENGGLKEEKVLFSFSWMSVSEGSAHTWLAGLICGKMIVEGAQGGPKLV